MKKIQEIIEVTIEAPCGIGSQTGKSEEIEILSRITNRFGGTQTYLASLFSAALLEYFSNTVKDDFSPDIMADYRAEMENRRKADAEAASLRTQLESRNKDYERLENMAKGELIGKNNTIKQFEAAVDDLRRRLAEKANQTSCAEQENMRLTEQVKELKVMLFDLQNKK